PTPFCISLCALAPTQYFPLSLHDALPISLMAEVQYVGAFAFHEFGERDLNARQVIADPAHPGFFYWGARPLYHIPGVFDTCAGRSEEHTFELQSPDHLVCRLLLEKQKHPD